MPLLPCIHYHSTLLPFKSEIFISGIILWMSVRVAKPQPTPLVSVRIEPKDVFISILLPIP